MAKRELAKELDRAHKLVCQAGFRLVTQIVRRRYRRADTELALRKCNEAVTILQQLIVANEPRG